MRLLLTAAVLSAATLASAVPAAAQSRAQEVARQLNNPLVQEVGAGALTALVGIVLDTRVGPLAKLADPREGIRPNDTLRDVQRRHDPAFEARLRDTTRNAIAAAGVLANDALAVQDEFGRTAARLQAALAPLSAMLDAQRDH